MPEGEPARVEPVLQVLTVHASPAIHRPTLAIERSDAVERLDVYRDRVLAPARAPAHAAPHAVRDDRHLERLGAAQHGVDLRVRVGPHDEARGRSPLTLPEPERAAGPEVPRDRVAIE